MSNLEKVNGIFGHCENVWVPRWFDEFSDPNGGFHERLDARGQPLLLPKRLVTQCRQLIVYSNHYETHRDAKRREKIASSFDFLLSKYHNRDSGGFHFSLTPQGTVENKSYDLYGHAFVLLACAAMHKAFGDEEALRAARKTLDFIDHKFRMPELPGLAEALGPDLNPLPEMRRQNPHMHLMEACIYMYETSKDAAYLALATEMLNLFKQYFRDREDGTLREFFDDRLGQHPEKGHLVEAGHHSEWVWLLARYQEASGQQDPLLQAYMKKLFAWAVEQGFDRKETGIYNTQKSDGAPVDRQKRIWPVMETLRAAAIMQKMEGFAAAGQQTVADCLTLADLYIASDGSWVEIMTENMTPLTDYRPGTTPYHICGALREAAHYLRPASL